MKLFIDTSKVEEISKYQDLGIVEGCTTNPKIMVEEDVEDWRTKLEQLSEIVEGSLSAEVTTNNAEEMVKQARELNLIGKNVNIKIPANRPGFKALSKLEDVDVNMTACMSPSQVLLAEKAGAEYASIFMGRISDMGNDPLEVIEKSSAMVESTDIIVGSIRKVYDIQEAFLAGADIVTTPPRFIGQMIEHKKTEEAVNEFLESGDFEA